MNVRQILLLFAAAMAASVQAAKPGTPIPAGTYQCMAGSSRMMLTLGRMQITGEKFVFTAPSGPATSGSYAITPQGYRWTGDIGAITNDQIVESGPDATPGQFWFSYRARPTSSPTTTSCAPV